MDVLDEEKTLLDEEEDCSDFENPPPKEHKRKRIDFAALDEKLGYERRMKENRSRGTHEKSMLSEVVKPDEGWRGLEDRLKTYIKLEVDRLRSFCEERFKALQAQCKPSSSAPSPPLSPERTLVTSTQPSKITSTPKHTTVPKTKCSSPMIIRKSPRHISHITPEAVNSAGIILMPCHLGSHWALLVCWIKEKRWEYYDSMPNSLHRAGVCDNLKALVDDVSTTFPKGFAKWPLEDVVGLPKQDNT
ncbi:hypothetical protein KSP40_PGU006902 [Platanthera guangdongensis]|uniref:Ubiquitin-like protease family profile domain-containing protein n=1 Tax=Platanthera guangdongensis TaxID=2320717 RepID=A0ABR2LYX4_9ASPA